jgi:outer membrane protein TolC
MNKLRAGLLLWILGAPAGTSAQALTEREVVERAVASNPSLRGALLELQRAQLSVDSEDARYTPTLILDAGVTRSEMPSLFGDDVRFIRSTTAQAGVAARKTFAFGTDLTLRLGSSFQRRDSGVVYEGLPPQPAIGPGYGLNARLTLAQPLLRGAGREVGEAALRAARVQRTAAELSRDRVASELLRDVLSAYWELWYSRASLAIEERSRALSEQQRNEARARAETGSLAPASVLTFETALATRQEAVLAARTDVERKRATLRQRIGDRAGMLADPNADALPEAPAPRPGAHDAALERSALVRERAAAITLADTQAKTAGDPLRSRLDLEAYLQAEGLGNQEVGAAAEGALTGQAISAHVGLVYETPFSSTRRNAEAARARIAVDTARAQLDEAKLAVASEIDIALAEHASGAERLTLAERTVEIARQQLTAEQARLATGATTPLTVVQAEEDLRGAELRVARARADLMQSALTIDHLTGDLLARHPL